MSNDFDAVSASGISQSRALLQPAVLKPTLLVVADEILEMDDALLARDAH